MPAAITTNTGVFICGSSCFSNAAAWRIFHGSIILLLQVLGKTGHTEAVEIIYDESKVSYQELLEIYWAQTDPTDAFGQFQDRGDNYRPIIFYENAKQKELAEASKAKLQASGRFDDPIVTQIEPTQPFYPAEDYHQQFYKKDPLRYTISSGLRHKFIEEHWKD